MKYTFNTLEEVKTAIEQWFITLGFDNKERAEKQYLKIIAEVGEMADALCKEDLENFKSEAGDVFVTIVGYCLQGNEYLRITHCPPTDMRIISIIDSIMYYLIHAEYISVIDYLQDICISQNTTLLECATIAYNKIQGRLERGELSVKNGTVIKSGK